METIFKDKPPKRTDVLRASPRVPNIFFLETWNFIIPKKNIRKNKEGYLQEFLIINS
jgi:hypothetical protein